VLQNFKQFEFLILWGSKSRSFLLSCSKYVQAANILREPVYYIKIRKGFLTYPVNKIQNADMRIRLK
jgi:hypothetical protein